ncbi:MAG: hypothetical protein PHE56_09215 [Bacteroidales bacterium]|nr:hypothetical protein [Bacteroidales bacterium]
MRLKGHDYSSVGNYFLTICCQNREHFFGKIENGVMILNDAGKMVEKWYFELENKYPDKRCHAMVIMPNHMHCIIENAPNTHETFQNENVGSCESIQRDAHVGTSLRGRPVDENQCCAKNDIGNDENRGRPVDKNQYYTNNEIGNDEKRCRPVGENQQQQMPQPNSKTKFTMIIIQYIFTSPSPPISPQTPSSSILVLAV